MGRVIPVVCGVVSLCACANNAAAGDWTFVPHLNVSEEYTDNVTLSGQDTLQDYITSINSGLSVRGESARLQSNIDYNLQKQIYDSEDDFSGLNHQLQGDSALTLVKQFLYFEAHSSISQQTISNSGTFDRNNRSQSGNRTDVIFREFKPIVRRHFGRYADFEGSFTKGKTSTNGGNVNSIGSSSDERVDLRLTGGDILGRVPASVVYNRSEQDFDSGSMNKQERLNFLTSYVLTRHFRTNFEFGHEENTSGSNNDSKGGTWAVGATWTPSRRAELTGQFAKRGFGNTKNFSARYQRRRWVFQANYNEDFRTRSQELRNLQLVPLFDEFGEPFFDPTANSNILNPEDLASIQEQAFQTEELNMRIHYRGRLTNASLSYYETKRTGQDFGGDSTNSGFNLSLNRNLSRRLRIAFLVNYRENENDTTLTNKDLLLSPSVSYTVGPHSDVNLSYTYRDGGGPDINNNYIENSLNASLTLHY